MIKLKWALPALCVAAVLPVLMRCRLLEEESILQSEPHSVQGATEEAMPDGQEGVSKNVHDESKGKASLVSVLVVENDSHLT